jgi:hypothetical protein
MGWINRYGVMDGLDFHQKETKLKGVKTPFFYLKPKIHKPHIYISEIIYFKNGY